MPHSVLDMFGIEHSKPGVNDMPEIWSLLLERKLIMVVTLHKIMPRPTMKDDSGNQEMASDAIEFITYLSLPFSLVSKKFCESGPLFVCHGARGPYVSLPTSSPKRFSLMICLISGLLSG